MDAVKQDETVVPESPEPRWLNGIERDAWLSLIGVIIRLPASLDTQLQRDAGLSHFEYIVMVNLSNADIRSYYIGRDDVTGWMTPGGASVLLPNGPAIQSMLQQALSPSPRTPDETVLTVEVRNGTGNSGWDALAAQRLNYAGYNTRIATADRQDYASSLLYDLGSSPNLNLSTSLLTILGLPSTDFVSAPTQADVNYVLILGQDYQPCFDPTHLAP